MLKTNLCLIGMPGSGKTTIAKGISQAENVPFVDTDEIIINEFGLTVTEIFSKLGETAFRDKESEIISTLRFLEGAVISTGGGAVLRQVNIESLKRHSFIVYLKADAELLSARLKNKQNRPLLEGDMRQRIEQILFERSKIYEAAADFVIDASIEKQDKIERIIEKWHVEQI